MLLGGGGGAAAAAAADCVLKPHGFARLDDRATEQQLLACRRRGYAEDSPRPLPGGSRLLVFLAELRVDNPLTVIKKTSESERGREGRNEGGSSDPQRGPQTHRADREEERKRTAVWGPKELGLDGRAFL